MLASMSVRHSHPIRPQGFVSWVVDRLRGREQLLVRPNGSLPLLLLGFPKGAGAVAREIEAAYTHTLPRLSPGTRSAYEDLFAAAPALVVVILRPRNACGCLGHHHPRLAESRLARRLAADLNEPVAEIDLAYDAIRNWEPEPLSALAAAGLGTALPVLHFQAAVLAVLLHELEHVVFPDRGEHEIRVRSNHFYTDAMQDLVAGDSGIGYGMASSPPPRP